MARPSASPAAVTAAKRSERGFEGALLGHLAELEVMRLLGDRAALNTFKSYPDLEETEYLVRHRPTGAIRGVQVKCLIVPNADTEGEIAFSSASFVPSRLTDFVVLAWRRDRTTLDDNAWLIPAADIPRLTRTDRRTARIELRIGITRGSHFDRYRPGCGEIATSIERRMPR